MPLKTRSKPLMTVMLLASSGMLLAGCVTDGSFATLKGASNSFVAPKYQVLGKTRYDQKWIDQTTEAGIAGFGWKRPAKRPAALNPKPVKSEPDPYACFGAERYKAMSEGRTCADDPKPTTFRKRWYDRFLRHKPAQ
jgi:hypothetical protein